MALPKGQTPEGAARACMQRENEGLSPKEAAQNAGMSLQSYRKMRDIVLLADRADLPRQDGNAAAQALAEMNDTCRVGPPYARVEHIVRRLWGDGRGVNRGAKEADRFERFDNAIGVISQVGQQAEALEVPHLTPEQVRQFDKQIGRAKQALQSLRTRIKEVQS